MAGERQLKIQMSPVSKVRGTGRGEGGRTVCGNTFLEPVLKFADLAAHCTLFICQTVKFGFEIRKVFFLFLETSTAPTAKETG